MNLDQERYSIKLETTSYICKSIIWQLHWNTWQTNLSVNNGQNNFIIYVQLAWCYNWGSEDVDQRNTVV